MRLIESRKADHLYVCKERDVSPSPNPWDDIRLIHQALPEVDMGDIDTSTVLFGRRLEAPLMVTAITGGFEGAIAINGNIAEACARTGIAMGVGSQRAALENGDDGSYGIVRDHDVPLVIGNIGVPQIIGQGGHEPLDASSVREAMEMVGATVVALHMNYLQEVIQPEGDTRSAGCIDAIREIARRAPVIAKETGAGISRSVAERLKGTGVSGMDVSGTGGTSFSAVEMHRSADKGERSFAALGDTFLDWGIPSTVSLVWSDVGLPLIASGGVRNGRDAARAIALGADCAGFAGPVVAAAMESADRVVEVIEGMKRELRVAMLLTGSGDVPALSRAERLVLGRTREWLEEGSV